LPAKRARAKPQWRCPECGHRFVTPNLAHSCGRYRLAAHFAGRPRELRRAFDRLVAVAREWGPVTVYAQKTRIVLQARVRFAGVTVRKDRLDAHLWLRRRAEHPLLGRVESLGRLGHICHFSLRQAADVDADLRDLVREAYAVNR